MAILHVYVDDKAMQRLAHASRTLGRTIHDLAESAVQESASNWYRDHPEADGEATASAHKRRG